MGVVKGMGKLSTKPWVSRMFGSGCRMGHGCASGTPKFHGGGRIKWGIMLGSGVVGCIGSLGMGMRMGMDFT